MISIIHIHSYEHFLSCDTYPQKDQTVSVFVKNSSDRRLVVDEATSFMGYFISESL